MTNTETVPTWPKIDARTREDGSGEVTINGTSHHIETNNIDEARSAILARVADTAAKMQRPVRVITTGPDGEWPLIVHPDGTVEPDPETESTPAPAAIDAAPEEAAQAPAAPYVDQAPAYDDPFALARHTSKPPALPTAVITAPPKSVPAEPLQVRPEIPELAPASVDVEPTPAARPTSADFADSIAPDPQEPAALGWRGFLRKGTFGLVAPAPGARELNLREWTSDVMRGLLEHKLIVVINEKGGVTKTTTSYLLSAVFGRVRGGTVLAWDNNENRGTLGMRGVPAANHDHTAIDLLEEIDTFGDATIKKDLLNYVRPQGANKFDLLASQNKVATKQVLEEATAFHRLWSSLNEAYRMIIVDTGNNSAASNWRAAVEAADEIVIVSTVREDSSQGAAVVADTLWSLGYEDKLRNAVTILAAPAEEVDEELRTRVTDHMSKLTRAVVHVPYDASLVNGGRIKYDHLSTASKDAWLNAAAEVMKGL